MPDDPRTPDDERARRLEAWRAALTQSLRRDVADFLKIVRGPQSPRAVGPRRPATGA